jgi:catechol 2,3-dioxygenase-like lactoylglutathione lyase family enzyme
MSTIFFVSDAGAAADFYADKLGFTVNWRFDEDGRTPAAGVSRGDCSLLLNTQRPDSVGKGTIYFAFGEAEHDAIRADLLAKGVALKEGWWGKRLMIVEDPDGNQLWFADPRDQG